MHRFTKVAGAVVALVGLLALAGPPALAESSLHGVVNVNTASAAELELLPGIGASRAAALIAAREEKGGFSSLEELLEVKGIGDASLAKLRPHLVLEGDTTARIE
jgi:competence protein ComEA